MVGMSIAGELGDIGFTWLELAFVTKLFPKKFSNMSTLRTRLNVMLYWLRGYFKTTILNKFAETIPSTFNTIRLSAATTEILLGSITTPRNPTEDQKIIPPIVTGIDFALITEHMSFLKQGRNMIGKLSVLNDILEGDQVANSLVKLGQVNIDEYQKENLAKLGVKYRPDKATIIFEPDFITFSASHLLDVNDYSQLLNAGHLGRFKICQAEITPEMARKYLKTDYPIDQELHEKLKKYNEVIGKQRIKIIETAPINLVDPIYDRILSAIEVPNQRTKGDVLRAMASFMVIRHLSEGNIKEAYTEADYSEDDAVFILQRIGEFIQPKLHPLVNDKSIRAKEPRKRDNAKDIILRFLTAVKQKGKNGAQLAVIHEVVEKEIPGFHYQSTINAIKELIKDRLVEKVPGAKGFYRIKEREE
jgi:hypothetical protein